ncbi:MAG: TVP38/TMEM64 family protein, partial [Candidatus Eiseniibacteriota bacterium]
LQRMEEGFRRNALSYLLVLRLIPVFPFWLVNLVPAFLNVPLRVYVLGTFLGIIPGTAVFASIGNGLGALLADCRKPDVGVVFQPMILLPLLGLAVLALLPALFKRWRARRT